MNFSDAILTHPAVISLMFIWKIKTYSHPQRSEFIYQVVHHYKKGMPPLPSHAQTLRYPDARYPDASVSGRFFLGTDFLNIILSHLSGIPRSGSGRSVFTTKCIFFLSFKQEIKSLTSILYLTSPIESDRGKIIFWTWNMIKDKNMYTTHTTTMRKIL